MINTAKKKKRNKNKNKSNQQETRKNNEETNSATIQFKKHNVQRTGKTPSTLHTVNNSFQVKSVNVQRSEKIPSASRTVNDDSSSSSCSSVDLKETVHNGEEESLEFTVNSGSEIMNLAKQLKIYKSYKQEEICTDTVMCIQRYLKNIFRQVRYLQYVYN